MMRAKARGIARGVIAAALVLLCSALPRSGEAELVAALSNSLVAVTTGFSGSEVLLFGATDGSGDIVVVVRGPESDVTVHRKGRNFGIWLNEAGLAFKGVPGYWMIAATRPVEQILPPEIAAFHQLGLQYLNFSPLEAASERRAREFRDALLREKVRAGLYSPQPGRIAFLGNRLFRTDVRVPANAPIGTYTVSVFLVRDGDVVNAESTPLVVGKVGFEARVFEFANKQSLAYGVLAVVIAAMAGWLANLAFRKG